MPKAKREALLAMAVPRLPEQYLPHVPHPPQLLFLNLDNPEAFYGGAAGGGKSDALIMTALQYVDVPDYSALILRRTFGDLTLPGAIMDRARDWLAGTDAKPFGGKGWRFPSGARLTFGYLQYPRDVEQYRGAEFQYIAMDEVTQFEERTYEFLFSRLRGPALPCADCGHMSSKMAGSPWLHDEGHPDDCLCGRLWTPSDISPSVLIEAEEKGERLTTAEPDRSSLTPAPDGTTLADVPLRMRSASNPGGVGHAWVRDRFVDPKTRRRAAVFVPARIEDNPSLDRRAYRESLSHLGSTEKARLEQGDWSATEEGSMFQRHWFEIVEEVPRAGITLVRYWDLAATDAAKAKRGDPDWTAGVLAGLHNGVWYVLDIRRKRLSPHAVEQLVLQTATQDRNQYGRVATWMEQEGGASGVKMIDDYRRLLAGFEFRGWKPITGKKDRARPVASAAEAGNVKLLRGDWIKEFLDEAEVFPIGAHDDQIDALSGCFETQTSRRARLIA